MASGIRPFQEDDIPACADLHSRVFRIAAAQGVDLAAAYRSYFHSVFLTSPDRYRALGPLVCEENGKVIGFLGAIPRPFRFRGRPIVAVLTSQFVVDPNSRSLAGVRLLKACMGGPQELTFADESNDVSRSLWERLGGRTAFVHSVHWTSILRLSQRLVEVQRPPKWLAGPAGSLARLIDGGLARAPKLALTSTLPAGLAARPLEARDLLRFWHECQASLLPDHDEASLRSTLDRIGHLRDLHGELRAVSLWTKEEQLAGAYAYHAPVGDVGSVVLFAAQPSWESQVLDHLRATASAAGLAALSGRVPPRHIHAFSRASCLLNKRPKWTLVHSASEPILNAALSGDDALSALDGEWPTHFNFRNAKG